MIYVKSLVAGVVAFAVTVVLYDIGIILYLQFYVLPKNPLPLNTEVAFDLSRMGIPLWGAPVLAAAACVGAGYWMFRRLSVAR